MAEVYILRMLDRFLIVVQVKELEYTYHRFGTNDTHETHIVHTRTTSPVEKTLSQFLTLTLAPIAKTFQPRHIFSRLLFPAQGYKKKISMGYRRLIKMSQ